MLQIGNLFITQLSVITEKCTETTNFKEPLTPDEFQEELLKIMKKTEPKKLPLEHYFELKIKGKKITKEFKIPENDLLV